MSHLPEGEAILLQMIKEQTEWRNRVRACPIRVNFFREPDESDDNFLCDLATRISDANHFLNFLGLDLEAGRKFVKQMLLLAEQISYEEGIYGDGWRERLTDNQYQLAWLIGATKFNDNGFVEAMRELKNYLVD